MTDETSQTAPTTATTTTTSMIILVACPFCEKKIEVNDYRTHTSECIHAPSSALLSEEQSNSNSVEITPASIAVPESTPAATEKLAPTRGTAERSDTNCEKEYSLLTCYGCGKRFLLPQAFESHLRTCRGKESQNDSGRKRKCPTPSSTTGDDFPSTPVHSLATTQPSTTPRLVMQLTCNGSASSASYISPESTRSASVCSQASAYPRVIFQQTSSIEDAETCSRLPPPLLVPTEVKQERDSNESTGPKPGIVCTPMSAGAAMAFHIRDILTRMGTLHDEIKDLRHRVELSEASFMLKLISIEKSLNDLKDIAKMRQQ